MSNCVYKYNGITYKSKQLLLNAISKSFIKSVNYVSEINKELSGSPFDIIEEMNIFSLMSAKYNEILQEAKDEHKGYSEFALRQQLVRKVLQFGTQSVNLKREQKELIGRSLKEIINNDQFWQTFKIQLAAREGIIIRDDSENVIEDLYLTKNWDDTETDKTDPILTANDEVKRLINRIPMVNPNEYRIDEKGNKVYISDTDTPTGYPNSLTWGIHGNNLFQIMQGTVTKEDMLNKLAEYSQYASTSFGKTLGNIYLELKDNSNLLSAWYSVFDKSILDSYRDLLRESEIGTELDIDISNKQKAPYVLANNWQNTLITRAENGYYNEEVLKQWESDYNKLSEKSNGFKLVDNIIANELSQLASQLGIVFSPSAILYNYDKFPNKFISTIISPILRIKGITPKQKTTAYLDTILKNPNIKFNEYNNLFRLANSVALFSEGITNYSNTNVKSNLIYDPQSHGFISAFFRDIKSTEENTIARLIDYTKVLANQHSFLLWGDLYDSPSGLGKPLVKGKGIFNYSIDENGLKTPVNDATLINKENLDRFKLVNFEGSKDLTFGIAKEYKEMAQFDWTLKTLLYYFHQKPSAINEENDYVSFFPLINPSDRGKTQFLTMSRQHLSKSNFELFVSHDNANPNFDELRKTPHFKMIRNTVYEELISMQEAKRVLFETDENGNTVFITNEEDPNFGKPKVKDDVLSGKFPTQMFYHYNVDDAGNKDFYKGNVFKFFNLVDVRGNNQYTLNDYDLFQNGGKIDLLTLVCASPDVNAMLKQDIARRRNNANIEPIKGKFGDLINLFTASYLNSTVRNAINDLSIYKETLEKITVKGRDVNDSHSLIIDKNFNRAVAEFALNTYLSNIEQYRLFQGSLADYKSRIDANKRAGQIMANGISNTLEGTFNGVTISDIKIKSLVYEAMVKKVAAIYGADDTNIVTKGKNPKVRVEVLKRLMIENNEKNLKSDNERKIYEMVKGYLSNDSANATSLITFDEFTKRVSGFGKYEQYKDIINKITNGIELNRDEYTRFATMQKNFYYDYRYNESLRKFIPNQVKNAEVILTPDLVKNLQLERLLHVMNTSGVHQVNLESAEKTGSFNILNIVDDKGNLVEDTKQLISDFTNNKRQYNYENLRMQQEVPDHIIDEYNKLGVQITKKMFDNVGDDVEYTLGGLPFKGSDLKAHSFELQSTNIENDAAKVMLDFGVLLDSNGELKNDIDLTILSSELIKQAIRRGLDKNTIFGVKLDEHSEFNLPLFITTYATTWQNLLTSIFTNRVTSQKFPGLHATQMANIFMDYDKTKHTKASDVLQQTGTNKEGINWHSSIIDGERDTYRLKSREFTGKDGNTIIEAEVLLPRWSKLFYATDVNGIKTGIDINTLPDDVRKMLGYRIPTESKYSTIVFKVVGFLPDANGATIILPDDFVTQTGSDFDIDSVYTMLYNLRKRDNKIEVIPYIDYTDSKYRQSRVEETLNNRNHLLSVLGDISSNFDELYTTIDKLNEITYRKLAFKDFQNKPEVKQMQKEIEDLYKLKKTLTRKERTEISFQIYDLQSILLTDEDNKAYEQNAVEDRKFMNDLRGKINDYYTTNKKSVEYQNTKEARQNRMLDVYLSILNHKNHYLESIVGATFADITKSKIIVDQLKQGANPTDIINNYYHPSNNPLPTTKRKLIDNLSYKGQQELRTLAMAGRQLKGITVAMNGFISIGQTAKIQINKDIAPQVVYKVYDKNTRDYLSDNFDATIGAKIEKEGEQSYWLVTVKHQHIGNNAAGTHTNIHNNKITSYFAQIPTNVLDNVKDPLPPNVDPYTIGVWTLLPMVGGDFATSTLFVNQPIISDMLNFYYSNLGNSKMKSKEVEQTKTQYQTWLYQVMKKSGKEKITDKLWDEQIAKKDDNGVAGKIHIFNNQQDAAYKILGYENNKGVPLYFDNLVKYNNFTTNKEIKDLINKEYTDSTEDQKQKKDDIVRLKELEDYLRHQLQILETYKEYSSIGQDIAMLSNVANTDRLGAGPDFETTNKLVNNIKLSAKSSTLLIDGQPAVTKIYPKFFGNNEVSAYPTLQTFLHSSNLLSVKSFANLFIDQTAIFGHFKQTVMDMFRSGDYDSKLAQKFVKYANVAILKDHYWLNNISQSEINTLLGKNETNKALEFNLDFKFDNTDEFNSMSLANQIMLVKEYKETVLEQDVDDEGNITTKKKHTPLTNHILNYLELQTEKQDFKRNGFYKVVYQANTFGNDVTRSFNELWYSKNIYERILARNLVRYEYIINGFSYGYASFAKVIPNNIHTKETDSFVQEEDKELYGEDYTENGIGTASHLYKALNTANSLEVSEENRDSDINYGMYKLFNMPIFDRFTRSNWKEYSIIPDATQLREVSNEDRIGTFQVDNKTDIITIPYSKYQQWGNGKFTNKIRESQYVKLGHDVDGETKYFLYKRDFSNVTQENIGTEQEPNMVGTGTIYYYPVAKLEEGESTDFSNVEENNKRPNGTRILDELDYLDRIDQLREKDKYTEKIYGEPLDMNMTRKDGKFRDEIDKKYQTTIDLIKAGLRTATTRKGTEANKWRGLRVGDIVKLRGVDVYIKITAAPYKLDLSTLEARKNWSKLEGWSIEEAHKYLNENGNQKEPLIQFQYEYIGTLKNVMENLNLELDNTETTTKNVSYTSTFNSEEVNKNLDEAQELEIKCK